MTDEDGLMYIFKVKVDLVIQHNVENDGPS
jgi:hypothetical protein